MESPSLPPYSSRIMRSCSWTVSPISKRIKTNIRHGGKDKLEQNTRESPEIFSAQLVFFFNKLQRTHMLSGLKARILSPELCQARVKSEADQLRRPPGARAWASQPTYEAACTLTLLLTPSLTSDYQKPGLQLL